MSTTASTHSPEASRPTHSLTGAAVLVRLAVRADRLRLAIWLGSITLYLLSTTSTVRQVYATAGDRAARAELITSPTAAFLAGPGYGVENYSFGAMFANEQTLYLMVAMVVLNVTLVVRRTRADEESGRAELVRSCPVGRHAALTAALLVAAATDLAFVVLSTGALTFLDFDFADTAALTGGIALSAFTFGALAAVTAQITEHARTATGTALALAVASYALRALGDTERSGGSALSWLSPLAWTQQAKPFVDLRLWPLLLYPLVAVPAVAVAVAVESRRDIGAGVFAVRPGRASAPAWLSTPLALVWRLERGSVLGWTVGTWLAAAAFGGVIGAAQQALKTNTTVPDLLRDRAGSLTEALVSTIMLVITLAVAGFAVSSISRGRIEEIAGRADNLLVSGAVSRERWLGSIVIVTAGATTVMVLLAGLALGATSASSTGIGTAEVVGLAASYVPALLVFVGFGLLLYGLSADAARLAFVPVLYAAVVGIAGVVLRLPQWALDLSPLTHIPPIGAFTWTPLVLCAVIALALAATGAFAYRRRDLRAS